jgi:hypothetical protein
MVKVNEAAVATTDKARWRQKERRRRKAATARAGCSQAASRTAGSSIQPMPVPLLSSSSDCRDSTLYPPKFGLAGPRAAAKTGRPAEQALLDSLIAPTLAGRTAAPRFLSAPMCFGEPYSRT